MKNCQRQTASELFAAESAKLRLPAEDAKV
jgi:hypothetical protein